MTKRAIKNVITALIEMAELLYTAALLFVKGVNNNIKGVMKYI